MYAFGIGMNLFAQHSCFRSNTLKKGNCNRYKVGVKHNVQKIEEEQHGCVWQRNILFDFESAVFFAISFSIDNSFFLFYATSIEKEKKKRKNIPLCTFFLFSLMLLQFVCLNGSTNLCKKKIEISNRSERAGRKIEK